jgi:hypothetical protein
MVAKAAFCDERILHRQLEELFKSARAMDLAATLDILKQIVPEHQSTLPGKVYLHPAVSQGVFSSRETG